MKNLVILCGGLSSRMGSDKARLSVGSTTFIEYLYAEAEKYFDRIIISIDTKEHADQISELPLFKSLCADGVADVFVLDKYEKAGPIGGILSVFEQTETERFSIISVDVPCADMRVLARLNELCRKGTCMLSLDGHRPEPLIAAYDRKVLPALQKAYDAGIYKLLAAVPEEQTEIISGHALSEQIEGLSEQSLVKAFRNYNTQEELRDLYD